MEFCRDRKDILHYFYMRSNKLLRDDEEKSSSLSSKENGRDSDETPIILVQITVYKAISFNNNTETN